MEKEIDAILSGTLVEFILIHTIYCVFKLFIFDCSLSDLITYISIGVALVSSVFVTFYKFKKKKMSYYAFESIALFVIIFLFLCLGAPIVSRFADKCHSGDWFSGINYTFFIAYYFFGRIGIYFVSSIIKAKSESKLK